MSVQFVTCFDRSFAQLGDLCVRSIQRFEGITQIHTASYGMVFDGSGKKQWIKLHAIRSAIESCRNTLEWVIWVDADCVMRRTFDFRGYLHKIDKCVHVVSTGDSNGICMCLFCVRVSEWSSRLLDTMLFCGDVACSSKYGDGYKAEQNCLKALCSEFPAVGKSVISIGSVMCKSDSTDTDTLDDVTPFYHYGVLDIQSRLSKMRIAAGM